jgi:glycosyltransferase involved in cell wall biosynthesis
LNCSDSPKISIGLPVFNGQQYLDEAVASIMSQTYSNFELIIADNCSTDDSLAIAKRWQEIDHRIKVIESPTNLGAAPNFNRVFAAAEGELFKWAPCDDLIEPDFLQKCIDRMENAPETVLVYSDAIKIDAEGNALRPIYDSEMNLKTDSPDPLVRFRDLVLYDHSCIAVFGLIRSDALKKTGLIGSYVASDRVLLAQLGLLGPFSRIEQPLIRHREHTGRSTRSIPRLKDRLAWFDTSLPSTRIFPNWRLLKEYASTITASDLSRWQTARCFVHLLRWIRCGGWKKLLDDLR